MKTWKISPASPLDRPLFLVLLTGVLFLFQSGSLPFLSADEPRYTRIAEEMLSSGDWIIPHLEGKPWLEKPPLFYWLAAGIFSLLGSGETQSRAVSALALAATGAALGFFGGRWFSPQAGRLAALMFVSSSAVIGFARGASMDALFTCLSFCGICAFGQALWEDSQRKHALYLTFSGVSIGLAVLAKGLLGLFLPVALLVLFCLWTESWHRLAWTGILLWGTVVLLVALPWHYLAFQREGFSFLATYLINHQVARFLTEIHHHTQSYFYYLLVLPASILPWTPFLLLLAQRHPPKRSQERPNIPRGHAILLMTFLTLFLLIFFSLSSSKLPGYILPACPPLVLLIAVRCLAEKDSGQSSKLPAIALYACAILMLLIGTALAVLLVKSYGISFLSASACGSAYWAGGLYLLWRMRRERPETGYHTLYIVPAIAQALLVILLSSLAFPAIGLRHSTKDLAEEAMVRLEPAEPFFSYRCFHHTLAYYSHYRWQGNMETPEELLQVLARQDRTSLMLMTEEKWIAEIERISRRQVIRLGRFGPRLLIRLSS